MERLTQHTQTGVSIILYNPQTEEEAFKQLMEKFKIVVNCLAAYEDTGLAPVEIEQMKTEREWVSVAERLPKKEDGDERGEVLCGDLYENSSIRFMKKFTCNWNERRNLIMDRVQVLQKCNNKSGFTRRIFLGVFADEQSVKEYTNRHPLDNNKWYDEWYENLPYTVERYKKAEEVF